MVGDDGCLKWDATGWADFGYCVNSDEDWLVGDGG